MSLRALLIASFYLLILPASAALAGEPPVPIEGKLLAEGDDLTVTVVQKQTAEERRERREEQQE